MAENTGPTTISPPALALGAVIGASAAGESTAAAPSGATTAAEDGDKAAAEGLVHEAVGDRVAAGGQEGDQVEQVDGERRHPPHGTLVVEDDPRLEEVGGRPADEELDDDDEQHLHHPTTRHDALPGTRLAHAHRRVARIGLPLPGVDVSGPSGRRLQHGVSVAQEGICQKRRSESVVRITTYRLLRVDFVFLQKNKTSMLSTTFHSFRNLARTKSRPWCKLGAFWASVT